MANEIPKVGQVLDGYRFNGGDPSDQTSWTPAIEPGQIMDGYRFKGGDPANKADWEKAENTIGSRFTQGVKQTLSAGEIGMTNDADKIAGLVAKGAREQLPETETQRKMAAEIKPYVEDAAKKEGSATKGLIEGGRLAGPVGAAIGAVEGLVTQYGALAAKRLSQFIANPSETAASMAENLPNSVPGMFGGGAGAIAGAPAGPIGSGAGAIIGGTAGGYLIEQGSAMREQILKEAQAQGIDPTDPVALAPLIKDNYDKFLKQSRLKGIGTAGTDAVLNTLTFGMAGMGERALAKEARALTGGIESGAIGAEQGAAQLAKIQAEQAARNTLTAKAARGGGIVAAEMAGEGGSEAVGQKLAYGEVNPLDVIDESLLGLGQGTSMSAGRGLYNKATGQVTPDMVKESVRRAEIALKAATDAGSAIDAANTMAGDLDMILSQVVTNDLTPAITADLAAGTTPTAPAGTALAPATVSALASRQAQIDRQAELLGLANTPGIPAFEREQLLAQAQTNLGEPKTGAAEGYSDLTPMDERQAKQRLAIMRDEAANAGQNALTLDVVPHPSLPGKFAIGQKTLPSLDLGTKAEPSAQEAQHRIETAALTGKVAEVSAEEQARRDMIDRAQRRVEARGGVASPEEARIFQEAGMGKPYDRIDESLSRPLGQAEKLTQATGIAVGNAPRGPSAAETETARVAKLQETNEESMARQERGAQTRAAQAEAATQAQIEAAGITPAAPNFNAVVQALATPGPQRSAEQSAVVRQARERMSSTDFSIAERAATAPFKLNQEERARLRTLRAGPAPVAQKQQAPVAPKVDELMGERVRAALGQPSNGSIVTSDAKLSTQRSTEVGSTGTINDNGKQHQYTVASGGRLTGMTKLIQQLARRFGKQVVFFNSDTLAADGFVLKGDNRTIYINAKSQMSPLAVFGHELMHLLKRDNPVAYRAVAAVVAARMDKETRAGFRRDYGKGANLEELSSDLLGNAFQDPDFLSDVFTEIANTAPEGEARNIIMQLAAAINKAIRAAIDVIRSMPKEAQAFKADELVKNLEDVRAALKTALVQYAKDQKIPAMKLEAELARAEGAASLTAKRGAEATLSQRRADFKNPEERQEVSTTSPKPAPAKGRESNPYTEKWIIDAKDVRASDKHVAAVVRALKKYNTMSGKGNDAQVMQELHDTVVENLLWLHDLVPANVRQRAKLWYDGANRIATDWTDKYNVSLRQAGGVLAVLSPQMDWFKNVSLGERILSIWTERQNEPWSPAMTAWVQSWVNAAKTVDDKEKRQAYLDKMAPLEGKTLAEMDGTEASYYIRVFDETYNERQYRLVTPEGGFGDYVTNTDDGDASVTWGGFGTIEKAVKILTDGSFKTIDSELGAEHKVRNFYNNIVSPNSADGHVTIDTHAVAAALVKGLSGSSEEVADNFGKAGGNVETGASGTYGLYADAYRDAAIKRGILPREMQSITWEAVRALFPAANKDKLAPQIDAIWDRFRKGEITRDQARKEVHDLAGGVRKMAWEGSDDGKFAADGGTSYNTKLAKDPADRPARTLAPETAKDKINVSLSPNTMSIPGVAALQDAAAAGDMAAHKLLQAVGLDNLRHLLDGTSARVKADGATGLYGGYLETALALQVSFADNDRTQVLAALAKFADNFNQEQIHVRRGTKDKAGTAFADGSYATPVYRWDLKEALTRKQIENVIEKSGLYGLTFGDDFVEAYYVGDPANEQAIKQFFANAAIADRLLGKAGGQVSRSVARLWAYGRGDGAIGYDTIRGDVAAGPSTSSATAKRVAEYLAGAKVKTFEQAAEITPAQDKLQTKLASIYESLPDNDLKNPNVRKAYAELAKEVLRQFKALPVKVEAMFAGGEPYANSNEMRRDILDNNHLYIFGTTPESFGPAGEDFTGHPLLEKSGLQDQNGHELLFNDLLRAVHDYYAHAMSTTQFGPKGEEAAWKNHMSMTNNPWARWALTSETRAQNSWVNFNEGLDRNTPISQREFARQKAVLVPVEYAMTGDRTVDKIMKEFSEKLGERVRQGSKPVKAEKPAKAAKAKLEVSLSRQRELEPIFKDLSSRGLKKTRAEKAIKSRPDVAQIQYVQDNFLDILDQLDTEGLVEINCD